VKGAVEAEVEAEVEAVEADVEADLEAVEGGIVPQISSSSIDSRSSC